ncbi:MAG: hypothetical protein H0W78_07575 [Planctomycetes bacterium]|jgi:hypothetical protein|nr:hypothetical protein [Planctomycetota bacterium]
MTPHLMISLAAVALTLLLTVGTVLSSSPSIAIPRTDLLVAAKDGDLIVVPADVVIKPLVAEFGGQPQFNPFTLKQVGPPKSTLPAPPPPPLDMPRPPILPLPEK